METVLARGVLAALATMLVLCPLCLSAFDLRVQCEYIPKYFNKLSDNSTDFIHLSCSTHVPLLLTDLRFDERHAFIGMEWRAHPGETVTYKMSFKCFNRTICRDPYLDAVQPSGVLTASTFQEFNLHFPCIGKGKATLGMSIQYTINKSDSSNFTNCGVPPYTPKAFRDKVNTCAGLDLGASSRPDASDADSSSGCQMDNGTGNGEECMPDANLSTPAPPMRSCAYPPLRLKMYKYCDAGSSSLVLNLAASASVTCVLLIFILAMVYIKHRQRRQAARYTVTDGEKSVFYQCRGDRQYTGDSVVSRGTILSTLSEGELAEVLVAVAAEWEQDFEPCLLSPDSIQIAEEIGRGAFGVVCKGTVTKRDTDSKAVAHVPVAVKTMKAPNCIEDITEFLEEAQLMKDFCDSNVVALVGVCLGSGSLPMICLEMMSNGDLRGYLRRNSSRESGTVRSEITLQQLLDFAADIASGMTYLAALKFVHRDLAARNCMLAGDLVAKVGDFGLARDVADGDYYRVGTARPLPVKWMAPECFEEQVFTSQSDVWAFGVTLWEIFSFGASPYSCTANHEMQDFLKSGHRMKAPLQMPDTLKIIMTACWRTEAGQRPTFQQIVNLVVGYIEAGDYENIQPLSSVREEACLEPFSSHPTPLLFEDEVLRRTSTPTPGHLYVCVEDGVDVDHGLPSPPSPPTMMTSNLANYLPPSPPSPTFLAHTETFVEPYSVAIIPSEFQNSRESCNVQYQNVVPLTEALEERAAAGQPGEKNDGEEGEESFTARHRYDTHCVGQDE